MMYSTGGYAGGLVELTIAVGYEAASMFVPISSTRTVQDFRLVDAFQTGWHMNYEHQLASESQIKAYFTEYIMRDELEKD